jgi:lysophospholipase L1-like esterase
MSALGGLRSLAIIYGFALHALLLVLIVKTDFIPRLEAKFAIINSNPKIQRTIQHHVWMDDLVPDRAIIFLGDSITQGLTTATIAPSAVNYGINSQNTVELLQAIPLYKSLSRASLIVMTIGINDFGQGINAGLNDRYKGIVAALPSDVPLLWNAVMPVDMGSDALAKIKDANMTIKELCEHRQNCTYLDNWEFMTDGNGQVKSDLFLDDKVHLDREGYRVWIHALRQAIKGISRSKAEPHISHDAPR